MLSGRDVAAYVKKGVKSIRRELKEHAAAARGEDDELLQVAEMCYLIRGMGVKTFRAFLAEGEGSTEPRRAEEFMRWALGDAARPLHRFVMACMEHGVKPSRLEACLKGLYGIWRATPSATCSTYVNMAIACALLSDRAEKQRCMVAEEAPLTLPELFALYVERARSGRLQTDVSALSVGALLHVVDVRLPASEFEWVYENMHYSRDAWGDVLEAVPYDNSWGARRRRTSSSYRIGQILSQGGADQHRAYVVVNSAKCMGIPAAMVQGMGSRGSLAWAALMGSDGVWRVYGAPGYGTGHYCDPCTGRDMPESALLQRESPSATKQREQAAGLALLMVWAEKLELPEVGVRCARQAAKLCPSYTAAWQKRCALMQKLTAEQLAATGGWSAFYRELLQQSGAHGELQALVPVVRKWFIEEQLQDAPPLPEYSPVATHRAARGEVAYVEVQFTRCAEDVVAPAEQGVSYCASGRTYVGRMVVWGHTGEPLLVAAVQSGGWMSLNSNFVTNGICPHDSLPGRYDPQEYPDTAFPRLAHETTMSTLRTGSLHGFQLVAPNTGRFALMIHYAERYGTEGCISTADTEVWEKFCEMMRSHSRRGIRYVPVRVSYACEPPNAERCPDSAQPEEEEEHDAGDDELGQHAG